MTKRKTTSKHHPREPNSLPQPPITTYDSGFEHSFEHWLEVRRKAKEADETHDVVFARPVKCDEAA
jgi:hypothetical protein